ncbi:MAG: lipoprotein insertase outer membrane protein LolB [Steroidobacteraceae bacterium]
MSPVRLRALAAAGLVALGACVSQPPAPERREFPWPQLREQLQRRSEFALDGRMAAAAGNQGFSGSFSWVQFQQASSVAISGPLGAGALRIALQDGQLTVQTAGGESVDGAAAREILERQLGFELPIERLRYWLQGVPAPASPAVELPDEAAQRLVGLQQDGWDLHFDAFEQTAAGWLPTRIVLRRGAARLRVLINTWRR